MASEVSICNRALQKLGATRITSLTQDSVTARACNVAYEHVRDAELRAHRWSFAIARTSIAADADEPEFGRANSFQLPVDFLKLIPPYVEDDWNSRDWIIEGRKILTDDASPLEIRYIKKETDPQQMDPLFREALSCKLAMELCEELTQSNQKLQALRVLYDDTIKAAKKANAIESVPMESVTDSWITVRA